MTDGHIGSVFDNEQDLLKAIIKLHAPNGVIELDPMFNKGHFYADFIPLPKYCFDIKPQAICCKKGNATCLPLLQNEVDYMILDPPFLFSVHGKAAEYGSSKRYGILKDFEALSELYKGILTEAERVLAPGGVLFFKCQDYTDRLTTMTHVHVYNWAVELGFYAKDLAILHKPRKVSNNNLEQRHLRKTHTYFWVFKKKKVE